MSTTKGGSWLIDKDGKKTQTRKPTQVVHKRNKAKADVAKSKPAKTKRGN